MKKVILLVIFICSAFVSIAFAAENNESNTLSLTLFDRLSVEQVNEFVKNVNKEYNSDLPQLDTATIQDIMVKGLPVNWQKMWQWVVSHFLQEIGTNVHFMGKLLFLSVLCALLQNLQNSFEKSTISSLSYGVCFVFLSTIALHAFYLVLMFAKHTVGIMVVFMEALLPLLLSLLAGAGGLTSATLLTPLMLFVINVVSVIIKDVVMPLLFLSAVLECVNYLSDKYQVSNLAGLLKQASMVILGLTLVVFIGVISIQGAAGSIADGITLRTAKYATSTFIPVVGKMFADTVELIMGASLLLKNAIGIFGVLFVAALCVFPLLKLLVLILIIKITGSLIQPMGDIKMAKCLTSIGDNLLMMLGAVITLTLMFFLTITILIGTGGISMLLR